jgi:hypothetical protein
MNIYDQIRQLLHANTWLTILAFVAIIAYYLNKWSREKKKNQQQVQATRASTGDKFHATQYEPIEYFVNETPSAPIPFGRKATWLAIKTDDAESVVAQFTKPGKKQFKTNVENGIQGAFAQYLFVMPPIQNWVLVVGYGFDLQDPDQFDKFLEMSRLYGEVQFFGSFRGVNYSAWARFVNGKVVRAYSVADGEVYFDEGDMTELEKTLVQEEMDRAVDVDERKWIATEGKLFCISSEENVSRMAAHWSIDPQKLENYPVVGLGTIMEV